jgi:L-amino acid N-acyltransferase YncA
VLLEIGTRISAFPVFSCGTRKLTVDSVIDEMRPEDWVQVRSIYLEGLATGEASFETEAASWQHWDATHHQHSRLVAKEGNRVISWAALAPVSSRQCYAGVAEVSLYVTGSYRRQGVGTRLLQALIDSSERNGIWSLVGSTFPENSASLAMQLACGFRIVGRRERIAQHHGVWRDTILTERRSRKVGIRDTKS